MVQDTKTRLEKEKSAIEEQRYQDAPEVLARPP